MQAGPAGPHGPGGVIEGEPTIFINNLPVVAKGHKVVEAAGGVSTVQMGCGTVFFGNGGGGGGGAGTAEDKVNRQQGRGREPSKKPDPANSDASAAAASNASAESETTYFDLWVRLHVDPRKAASIGDVFRLTSPDGSVSMERTVADDLVPNDDCVDLLFPHLEVEKSYSLQVVEDGERTC